MAWSRIKASQGLSPGPSEGEGARGRGPSQLPSSQARLNASGARLRRYEPPRASAPVPDNQHAPAWTTAAVPAVYPHPVQVYAATAYAATAAWPTNCQAYRQWPSWPQQPPTQQQQLPTQPLRTQQPPAQLQQTVAKKARVDSQRPAHDESRAAEDASAAVGLRPQKMPDKNILNLCIRCLYFIWGVQKVLEPELPGARTC